MIVLVLATHIYSTPMYILVCAINHNEIIYLITLVSMQYGRILHESGDVFSRVRSSN